MYLKIEKNKRRGGVPLLGRYSEGFGHLSESAFSHFNTVSLCRNGFTLAEMLVVMLILTIVLAAFAPLMTKRRTVDNTSPWRYATNNSDIYYGLAANQTAMIGQNEKSSSDLDSRLLINTSDSDQAHVAFSSSGTKLGQLYMNSNGVLLGGLSDKVVNLPSGTTGVGYGVFGAGNSTGSNNTALGLSSLYNNTTGYINVAVGYSSLNSNTTGNFNTAVGNLSLYNNTTADANTAVGLRSLYSNTTGEQNTAVGYDSLYSNTTGGQNTAVGLSSLYGNTTGNYNTALGYSSMYYNTTGGYNTAVGPYSLTRNTTGNYNTTVGYSSLNSNTTGEENTALGGYSLYGNTTGDNNTAMGYYSLYGNTTGYSNTASGYNSLRSNTTGNYNTAVGYSCLRSNTTGSSNTALGRDSLYSNTTGTWNSAIGHDSLRNNSEGNQNTALGHYSLYSNTTGSYNVALGDWSLYANTKGNNNTALGYSACQHVTGSNKTCIGHMSGPSIGSTSSSNTTREIYIGSPSSPAKTLVYNDLTVYGTYSNPSDRRLKNVKGEYKGGLEKLRELKIYNFTFKKDKEKTPRVGVISQEVQKIFPNAVTKDADGYLMLRKEDIFFTMVNAIKELDKIIQGLIGEVKTALIKLNSHDEEIKKLQQENQDLKARIERLEKLVK